MSAHSLVIGAGPAGLAVAALLGQRGVPYRIVDRAPTVGDSWRGRYDSLRLHTARRLSGLPGAPIPRRYGQWVARDDLVAYLEDYVRRFGIRPELETEVTGLHRGGDGWLVQTSRGEVPARSVVIATGQARTPYVPPWPGRDSYPGDLRHSSAYREPTAFRNQRVLVVGGGNSAAEIAVDLVGHATAVWLSVRSAPGIVRRDTLGVPTQFVALVLRGFPAALLNPVSDLLRRVTVPDLEPYGLPAPRDSFTRFLRSQTIPILDHGFVDAVRARRIRVVGEVTAFAGAEVQLVDQTTLTPDAVVAATGFRPDLGEMVRGLDLLDPAGVPRVRGAQTTPRAPDLYLVGITVELSGLLREITREATAVADAIAARR